MMLRALTPNRLSRHYVSGPVTDHSAPHYRYNPPFALFWVLHRLKRAWLVVAALSHRNHKALQSTRLIQSARKTGLDAHSPRQKSNLL
jgi:hypothetical protein